MQTRRPLRQSGQIGSLRRGQIGQRHVEIGLRSGGNTIGILTKENLVQIQLKDTFLAHGSLNPCGQNDFLHLALNRAAAIEKEILHHLLRDGGGATHILPARTHRIHKGRCNRARIIARMLIEIAIFGADKGMSHQIRDFFGWHENTALLREFVNDTAFARIDTADCGRGILRQRFVIGQIARKNPNHAANNNGTKHNRHDRRGKEPAENTHHKTDDLAHACHFPKKPYPKRVSAYRAQPRARQKLKPSLHGEITQDYRRIRLRRRLSSANHASMARAIPPCARDRQTGSRIFSKSPPSDIKPISKRTEG